MTDFSFHNQVAETTQVGTQFPALSTSRKHRTAGECLFFFIVLTTLVAGAGDVEIFGANLCGLSWISSLLVSLLSLLFIRSGKISFPFLSWLPFFGYVLLRSDVLSRNDLQRLAIMITPIIVAVALSRLPVKNLRLVRKLYYAVLIVTTCNFLVAVIEGHWFLLPLQGSWIGHMAFNGV